MAANTQIYNAYSQSQIDFEASPQKLIEMLYEGLLRFCSRIKVFIKKDDIEQRLYYTKRATAIFIELINSLDYERGGDVAYYLNGLYLQEIKLLSQANLRNDEAKVDEVINVVRCLLEAWREIHPDLNAGANSMDANKASNQQANLGAVNSGVNSAESAKTAAAVNSNSEPLNLGGNPTQPSLRGSQSEPKQSTSLNLNENSSVNLAVNSATNSAENAKTATAVNSSVNSSSEPLNLGGNPAQPSLRGSQSEPKQSTSLNLNENPSVNSTPLNSSVNSANATATNPAINSTTATAKNAENSGEIPAQNQNDLDEIVKLNLARNEPKPEKVEDTSYEDMFLAMNAMRSNTATQ